MPAEPGWWNWGWGYFFGGKVWDGKDGITANSPENIRAFEWIQSWSKKYGEAGALNPMSQTFNEEYAQKGMTLALGTQKKRPRQWVLLGVIRLDEPKQASFVF